MSIGLETVGVKKFEVHRTQARNRMGDLLLAGRDSIYFSWIRIKKGIL